METTDITGQHPDSHNIYSKQFVSFFSDCETFISSMRKRGAESFAASASAKQKPGHRSAMIAKDIYDKNADVDYHATPPPDNRAGGDSKRDNQCRHGLFKKTP